MLEANRFPFGLLSVGLDGRVQAANRYAATLLGAEPDALSGQPVDGLLSAGGRMLYHTYLVPLLQLHGHVHEFALPLVSRGGAPVDVLVYGSRDDAVEPPRVVMALLPMHERRRIENELLRAQRVADSAPGMLFEYVVGPDGRGRFPYVSAGSTQIYGLRPEQLVRSDEPLLALVHPDDRAALVEARRRSRGEENSWSGTYRARRRGDSEGWAWHSVRATPRLQGDGTVVWHGVVTDITRQREMELAEKTHKVAEQASRAKSEFLARMSHELRTPLNAIIGFSQLLAGDAQAADWQEEQRRRLGIIESSGRRLLALIDEVLDISRIEAGRIELHAADVPLQPLLAETLLLVEPMARLRDIELRCEVDEPLVVRADAGRLGQIVANLLSNAVKYNRPHGRVDVVARNEAGLVRIEVADTGLGMNAAQRAQLFQPFNRLGAERTRTEGTGLGLVITRDLAELMGGRLEVDSEPGRGTRMSLLLPPGVATTAPTPLAAPADEPTASPSRPEARVLCVEDNAVNILLLEAMLHPLPGLSIEVAEDGASALAAAQTQRPDLLLLDMNLPDIDGCTLLQRLRALDGLNAVPAVAVSADAMPSHIERARQAGFHAYWTKPLDVAQVQRDVQRLLASAGGIDTTVSGR